MTATNITALPTADIATQPKRAPMFALTPQTLEEAMQFADMMSRSSIVPKDYQGNPGNIIVAIQWGAEIGLAPLQAMQSIAVINGRPSIWGDAMLALVRGSGLLEFIRETPTDEGCTCALKRRGDPNEVERTFTPEDAKKAGLWGKQGPWQQHPKRMMQMRARAFALRDVFPDVLRGVHIGEEAQDMPVERNMGAADEVSLDQPKIEHSRADKAREAIAKRKALSSPALSDVINAISSSATLDALKAAGELAAALASDEERKKARAAYKTRHIEIKVADSTDQTTGEIKAPKRTYANYADAIKGATSAETAALELDAARSELPPEYIEELGAVFGARWDK